MYTREVWAMPKETSNHPEYPSTSYPVLVNLCKSTML